MGTKHLLLALAFAFLLAGCCALEAELNSRAFQKGDTLSVAGTAEGMVSIRALQNGKLIFSTKTIPAEGGLFSFSRKIDLLDPKGAWDVVVSDANESLSEKITVIPTRQSEFLLISFLSPTPTSYYRTSGVKLVVRVTDSGRAAANASVYSWDFSGMKCSLKNNHDGTYSADFAIPHDALVGGWELKVVAAAYSGSELIGGENSISLDIERSPITIELISPRADEYNVGENLQIELRVGYVGGEAVKGARVYATVNYEPVELEQGDSGVYAGIFYPKAVKNEPLAISIRAEDGAQNYGTKTMLLKPANYFWWLLRENGVLYLFPALFLAYIFYLSARELHTFASRSALKRKRQEMLALKKRLHNDFYRRGIVSGANFGRRNAEYNAELNGLEAALKNFRED